MSSFFFYYFFCLNKNITKTPGSNSALAEFDPLENPLGVGFLKQVEEFTAPVGRPYDLSTARALLIATQPVWVFALFVKDFSLFSYMYFVSPLVYRKMATLARISGPVIYLAS